MKKTKVIAFLLILTMACCLLPAAALADNGETVLKTTVPDASYTISIPSEAEIPYGAESTVIGEVSVTEVEHASSVTCAVTCTDLEGKAGVIPVTYRYAYAGGERLLLEGTALSAYQNGAAVSATLYADIAQSDWEAAASGDYQATMTFRFSATGSGIYADKSLWAFDESDETGAVDVFFVAPTTTDQAGVGGYNMTLDNETVMKKQAIQIQNQKGIYDNVGREQPTDPEDQSVNTRFFAPFIRQAVMECFTDMSSEERAPYLSVAYADLKAAFEYYMENINGGNPVILAGSSQGAELLSWLVRDYFNTEETADKLIACYAIGWKIDEEYMSGLKYVHFAEGEKDTRAIVSFNSEADFITESLIVGKDEKALCINPLSWSTSYEAVGKEKNLGCCVYSTSKGKRAQDDAKIPGEIPEFCGAYIDEVRGTLKVTGVTDYPGAESLFPSYIAGQPFGVFHSWDWEFFYRNLEANVTARIAAYLGE